MGWHKILIYTISPLKTGLIPSWLIWKTPLDLFLSFSSPTRGTKSHFRCNFARTLWAKRMATGGGEGRWTAKHTEEQCSPRPAPSSTPSERTPTIHPPRVPVQAKLGWTRGSWTLLRPQLTGLRTPYPQIQGKAPRKASFCPKSPVLPKSPPLFL